MAEQITLQEYYHVLSHMKEPISLESLKTKQTIVDPGYVRSIVESTVRLGHAIKINDLYEITYEGNQFLVMNSSKIEATK